MPRMVRLLALVMLGVIALAAPAAAATLTVTTTSDSAAGTCNPAPGACTLRDAITQAADGDTVMVPASSGHYQITNGEIPINHAITVQGAGSGSTVIDAGNYGRIFAVHTNYGTTITIAGTELTRGGGGTTGGGAIRVDNGASLVLSNDVIDHNAAQLGGQSNDAQGGGAIKNDGPGTLTLTNTTVDDNTFSLASNGSRYDGGGGIWSGGPLIATASHIDSNTVNLTGQLNDTSPGCCSGGGGAFLVASRNNSLSNSTVDSNTVTVSSGQCCFGGGGIYVGGSAGAFSTTLADTAVNANTVNVTGPSVTASDDNHCCSGGGGIWTASGLTMIGGSISADTASVTAGDCCHGGGGGYVFGDRQPSSFTDATVSGNTLSVNGSGGDVGGGGLIDEVNPVTAAAFSTRLTIDSSTIASNQANITGGASVSGGGGLHLSLDAANSIFNSTISDNTTSAAGADQGGGGVFAGKVAGASQSLTLANATIAGNSAPAGGGGGLLSSGLDIRSENSLIALNSAMSAGECLGFAGASFTSLGYNLSDSPGTCNFTAAGDQVVARSSVGLGPLQDNGGPTLTRALAAGSSAINAGNPSGCADPAGGVLAIDQRGLVRPSGGRCDIGAFEFQQAGSTVPPAGGTVVPPAGATVVPPAGGTVGPLAGGTLVPPSRAFAFSLQSDSAGNISTTIVARGGGRFTATATFKPKGSGKPLLFASRSATTPTPGVVVIDLAPDAQAKAVLMNHQRLTVSVEVTFSPTSGSKEHKQKSIGVTALKAPANRQQAEQIPLLLDVTGTTSVSIRLDATIDEVVFSGLLNYTKATNYAGHRVPPALGELARDKCVEVFDAGKSLGPRPHGPHPGAKIWEMQSPGFLLNLTVGTTTFIGNGRWSRLMFPGDVGKPVTIAVGQLDPFENYVGEKTVGFKFKGQSVQASCEAVSVTQTYEGPQANHGG